LPIPASARVGIKDFSETFDQRSSPARTLTTIISPRRCSASKRMSTLSAIGPRSLAYTE
jgi:hypothetical protein